MSIWVNIHHAPLSAVYYPYSFPLPPQEHFQARKACGLSMHGVLIANEVGRIVSLGWGFCLCFCHFFFLWYWCCSLHFGYEAIRCFSGSCLFPCRLNKWWCFGSSLRFCLLSCDIVLIGGLAGWCLLRYRSARLLGHHSRCQCHWDLSDLNICFRLSSVVL